MTTLLKKASSLAILLTAGGYSFAASLLVQNINDAGDSAYGLYSSDSHLISKSEQTTIRVGFFTLSKDEVVSGFESGDFTSLNANFLPFGKDLNVNITDGVFQHQVNGNSSAFAGKEVVIWISSNGFNSSSANEQLIFISDTSFKAEPWVNGEVILSPDYGTLLVGEYGNYKTDFGKGGPSLLGYNTVSYESNGIDTSDTTSGTDDTGSGSDTDSGSIGGGTAVADNSGNGSSTDTDAETPTTDNGSSSETFTDPDPTNPVPYALRDSKAFTNGYYFSDWFGDFFKGEDSAVDNFVYSLDFGWAYIAPNSTPSGAWFWSKSFGGWLWGSEQSTRFFYSQADASWIYAVSKDGGGAYIYSNSTDSWSTLEL